MSLEWVNIGVCCDVINGSTPSRLKPEFWNGDIDWFTPKDLSKLQGKYIDSAPEKISELGYKSCSTTMIPTGSLLFTSRAPIGHIAINKRRVCTNQGFKTLVPKNGVDVEYLYYVMKKYTPILQDLGNGATFKELSKTTISSFAIPLPPLDQQKKIAAILDAADAYRQKTKALIAKYNALSQSLFLEMFGDPVTNPKGWEYTTVGENISFMTSGSRGWAKYYAEQGHIFLRIQNVGYNQLRLDDLTCVDAPDSAESKRTLVEPGDVLLTITADLGRTAVIPDNFPKANINQHLAILRFQKSWNPNFVSAYIASRGGQSMFLKLDKGGVKAGLNFNDIKSYQIFITPLKLQNQFAERIQAIETQKSQAQASLQKAEELFASVLQKAFKGELV